jgi:2,4-dienoyl-CoA reductase-like NADH-dependent reductase (Old Yellow Enzyme family)
MSTSAASRANIGRLFEPVTIGALSLRNHFIMASLTRNRGVIPGQHFIDYYQQRAKHSGLILTEGTLLEPLGSEWPFAPGIFRTDQVEAWRQVIKAVHSEGCLMGIQLWHLGRVVHPLHQAGLPNMGPSAIGAKGGKFRLLKGEPGYVKPQAIVNPEDYIAMYKAGAINAKAAGFDMAEIHGANGSGTGTQHSLPSSHLCPGSISHLNDPSASLAAVLC